MLNAAIGDCPVAGGKLKTTIRPPGQAGVHKVVRVGDSAVAVIADTWWRARTALEALPFEWMRSEQDALERRHRRPGKGWPRRQEAFVGNQAGDPGGAIASAVRRVERSIRTRSRTRRRWSR